MATDAQRQMDEKLAKVWGDDKLASQPVARPLRQRLVITPEREEAASRAKREVTERLFSDRRDT